MINFGHLIPFYHQSYYNHGIHTEFINILCKKSSESIPMEDIREDFNDTGFDHCKSAC